MKIRYILLSVIMLVTGANIALERQAKVDYNHCLNTTKLSSIECSYLTGHFPGSNKESRGR